MTGNTLGWVIVAFVLYLLMMIAIGALYAKGNNNSEDYFLGGRKLNGFVAALSAQASDMSGWLLMGLPGAIYLTGVGGDGWIAIGLFHRHDVKLAVHRHEAAQIYDPRQQFCDTADLF